MNTATQTLVEFEATYHLSKCIFDGIALLIPQVEILSVESVCDITVNSEFTNSLGTIRFRGQSIPVYCFSREMNVLVVIPEDRSQCVVISNANICFSILCSDVKNISLSDMRFKEIPPAINTSYTPLRFLSLYREDSNRLNLGFITDAEKLKEYFESIDATNSKESKNGS